MISQGGACGRVPAIHVRKLTAFAIVLSVVTLSAADELRIVPLVRNGHVLVTFQMQDGYTDEVRAAIQSGLKTTFTYTIELRTPVAVWLDRTLATAVVSTSVQFDNLTRRHTVERRLDGRVEDAQIVEGDEDVRQLVTKFERLPLFRTSSLEPNREYYVRVRAEVRPRSASFLWPWGSGRSAQAKFTFIP
jgi:hypothetical protein